MLPSADPACATVRLRPVLDLTAAAPLKAEFMAARGCPVVVDASEVDRVGGLCLQVLLSAQATWQAETRPFRVASASDGFRDALAVLGASHLIAPAPDGAPS